MEAAFAPVITFQFIFLIFIRWCWLTNNLKIKSYEFYRFLFVTSSRTAEVRRRKSLANSCNFSRIMKDIWEVLSVDDILPELKKKLKKNFVGKWKPGKDCGHWGNWSCNAANTIIVKMWEWSWTSRVCVHFFHNNFCFNQFEIWWTSGNLSWVID